MDTRSDIQNIRSAEEVFSNLFDRLAPRECVGAEHAENGKILLAALLFCRQTCALSAQAMEQRAYLHEQTLARPLLDLSIRLLFACRMPDGWRRYKRHWAEEDLGWAKEAKELFPSEPHWDSWIEESQARVDALSVPKMSRRLPIVIKELFRFESDEVAAGREGYRVNEHHAPEANHMVFKVSHSVTHGCPEYLKYNLEAFLEAHPFTTHNGSAYLQAAHFMTRAIYLFCGWPNREQDSLAVLARGVPRPSRADPPDAPPTPQV